MVVMNGQNDKRTIDPSRFKEITKDFTKAKNIVTNEVLNLNSKWEVPEKSILIMELSK